MNRNLVIFIVALAALLGSLTTALATRSERDFQLRGYADASRDPNLPVRLPLLGVNVELTQYPATALSTHLRLMDDAGITWVRQFARWDEIEPDRGQFNWQTWDAIIDAVQDHPGLRLVAVLMNSPTWARPDSPEGPVTGPPVNPEDFARFASAFASRYGHTIDYYQVWDEPNLTAAWGQLEPRVADYAAVLAAGYEAVHAADANAAVIAAALAPTVETGPRNISDILYLRDLYALGANVYLDAAAAKPYGFDFSPEDRLISSDTLNFSRVITLREIMLRGGDGKKALWLSNWGWNTLPQDWSSSPSIWGSVNPSQQTTYTLSALERAEREWPWSGGMILHHWQPDAAPDDPLWGFTLIDPDGVPTPLYHALAERPRSEIATNGFYPAANPYTHYSGVWTFGSLGADIGWVQDSHFSFYFSGTAVSLLIRQDDYTAYLYPSVDGEPANALPRDTSGNAYLVLTSGSQLPELNLLPVAMNLAPGSHILHAVADRGWDRWALAGFGVSSGNLAEPYDRQEHIAWLTAAIAAIAVAVSASTLRISTRFRVLTALNNRLDSGVQLAIGAVTALALLVGMLLTWGDSLPNLFRRDPVPLVLAALTAGLIQLQPGLILSLLAAAILLVVIYNRLEIGLILTIFWTPFFLFPVELYRFALPMSEMLILLTAAAALLRGLAHWGRNRQILVPPFNRLTITSAVKHLTPLDYIVLAYVVLGAMTLLWVQHRGQAMTELRVMFVEPALFYLIFRTTARDQLTYIRLVDALILAGFFVAAIGLLQFVRGEAIITAEAGAQRLASVYGSPNNVGLFLGRCIPFALAFLLLPVNRPRRIAAGVALAVMGLAVLLSQSVGAIFIGIPAGLIAVILIVGKKRGRLIVIGLIAVGLIAFVVSLQSPRFARVLDFNSGTNFFRIRVWQSALNIIHDHPITGLGLDQFLYAFRGHYIQPDAWQEPDLSHPHNIVMDFWIRLGLPGVVLLTGIIVAFMRAMSREYRFWQQRSPLMFAITVGAIGSMVNLIAHGLIDNSVYVQDLCYVFVLLLALSIARSNIRAIDEPS